MSERQDRFGNPIDPTVGYARGRVLRGTDEEVAKTLRARALVRELAPAGGVTHPSVTRPIAMAGATFEEFHDLQSLERAWRAGPTPRLVVVTPITASKRHLDLAVFCRALGLPREARTLVYV